MINSCFLPLVPFCSAASGQGSPGDQRKHGSRLLSSNALIMQNCLT